MQSGTQNLSCLLYGPHDARFQDRPIPEIKDPHDVLVRIAYTGVCGSDVHFWHQGGIKNYVSEAQPIVIGHEASGIIHAVGPAVTSLVPGDRVSIEPGYACRRCDRCKSGKYNLCADMKFAADPPHTHGTLTKYFLLPADFCYRIPDSLSLTEAVLIEPLAVGVHAVRLADVRAGQRVVVFGAGTVGLSCGAVAREFGAANVILVDISESRIQFAQSFLGAQVGGTYKVDTALTPEENAQNLIREHDLGEGADVVIDASGAVPSIQSSIYVLRPGGTYVQAGMGERKVEFPIAAVCEKELTVKGCFRYGPGDFKLGISLVTKGKIQVKPLISKIFPFESATQAWETTSRGEGIKTLIEGPKDN